MLEEKEEKRRKDLENMEIMLSRRDPRFVGRTTVVSKILQVFQDDSHAKCRCVLVYGLAGTGKTKLAAESCAVYKEQARCDTRLVGDLCCCHSCRRDGLRRQETVGRSPSHYETCHIRQCTNENNEVIY